MKAFISSLFTEDTYNVWVIWGSRAYEKHGMLTETLKGAHSSTRIPVAHLIILLPKL